MNRQKEEDKHTAIHDTFIATYTKLNVEWCRMESAQKRWEYKRIQIIEQRMQYQECGRVDDFGGLEATSTDCIHMNI